MQVYNYIYMIMFNTHTSLQNYKGILWNSNILFSILLVAPKSFCLKNQAYPVLGRTYLWTISTAGVCRVIT